MGCLMGRSVLVALGGFLFLKACYCSGAFNLTKFLGIPCKSAN
jgi:hypothetical protein